MYLNVVFLIYLFGLVRAAFEGETCVKDGFAGTCVNLGRCQRAIDDLKKKINPQICSFDDATPIVCCVNNNGNSPRPTTTPIPVATTTRRSSTTTEYIPELPTYENLGPEGECEALPMSLTSPKTGQKAWDKCVEYQEQLVYPCEPGAVLTGELSRSNHCYHNADELIVGGTDAAANEFPHMVILGYGDNRSSLNWLCGGALISDRFVLTAGHCIAGNAADGPVTHVLVGALRRGETADDSKIFKVNRIIKHPDYKSPSKYHDIALLEIATRVNLTQFVVPACLHVGDAVDDSRATATGWGLTQYKGSTSEVLQKVILNKFSTDECAVKFPEHRNMKNGFDAVTQTCYGDKSQSKDTCQGDSGGPLQIKSKKINCMYIITGVTSFGKACGFVGDPGIYTRVAPYVAWIESVVWP